MHSGVLELFILIALRDPQFRQNFRPSNMSLSCQISPRFLCCEMMHFCQSKVQSVSIYDIREGRYLRLSNHEPQRSWTTLFLNQATSTSTRSWAWRCSLCWRSVGTDSMEMQIVWSSLLFQACEVDYSETRSSSSTPWSRGQPRRSSARWTTVVCTIVNLKFKERSWASTIYPFSFLITRYIFQKRNAQSAGTR